MGTYGAEAESEVCVQVLFKPALTYVRGKTWAFLDHQQSVSGEGFGLFQGSGMNNLCIFAIENEVQRGRGRWRENVQFEIQYVKSNMSKSRDLFFVLACLIRDYQSVNVR